MMNKKFSKTEIKGLPGGPNEQFTYVTGVFLQDMYHTPIAQKGLEKYQGNKKSETLVPKEKLDRYLRNTQAKLIDDSNVPLYKAYDDALPTPTVRAYNVPTTAEKFGMIGSTLKDKAIETAKTLKDYSPIGAAERIYEDPTGYLNSAGQFISDIATLNKAPDLSNWMKMLDVAEVTPLVGLGAKGANLGYNALQYTPVEGMMYRGIGKKGMKDAKRSGVFRPKAPGIDDKMAKLLKQQQEVKLREKVFDKTYYGPDFEIAKRYGKGYIVEVPFDAAKFVRRYGNKDWSWHTTRQIPIEEGRILKRNWLGLYRPIKQQGGEGYRIDASDYNDPYKLISSGNITMTEKDGGPLKKGPLLGIDNLGNQQMMYPGYNYVFPGNMVMEIPVAQKGKEEKKAQYLNSEVFDDLKDQSKKSTGVIEQAEEVSLPNRILNAMAQPMTYRANKNQGINSPYVIGLNPFDIALAYVNPTVAFKTGKNAIEETAKGNYGNALLNAAYTASYLPYLKALPLKQDGGTSWTDYLNPFNWGAKNMDKVGDFQTAFRTARGAGYDDFMWQGKRYSTELAEQPDYENLFYDKSLLDNLSDKQKQRREALLYNADLIAKSQGDNEDLRRMLIMTAAMENSLGANPNAYGRDYTRGPMSIDNIAWQDVFDVREGANNYTAQQKKNEKWLNSLGLDMNNLETLLRSDDPLASMAVARLVYGRIPEALPSGDDPKAMFDYYLNYYNRKGLLKHGTAEQHYARFLKDYNRIYGKTGGEFQRLVDKYTTKGWNSLTDKEKQEYKNYYNNM